MENTADLRKVIARAFAALIEDPKIASEIAFHMTDWDNDLKDLLELYESPSSFSDDEIQDRLFGFLIHVPNHVAAAKKLAGLGPVQDVFEVGVCTEDEE